MGIDSKLHDALVSCQRSLKASEPYIDRQTKIWAKYALRTVDKALKGKRYAEVTYWLGWFEGVMSGHTGSENRRSRFAKLFSPLKTEADDRIAVVVGAGYRCADCGTPIVYFERVVRAPQAIVSSDGICGVLDDESAERLAAIGISLPGDVDATETDLLSGHVGVHMASVDLLPTHGEETIALLVALFKQNGWAVAEDFEDYAARWRNHGKHEKGPANG